MKKKIVVIIGIIVLFVGASVASGINNNVEITKDIDNIENLNFDSWWDNDWYYRKQITIDHNYVEGTLNNFPVLVVHTSSDLADNAQPDGDDIVFTTDSGVKLYHEIEYYGSSSGKLVAWVNIPILSSIEDTVFYIYYGNNDCSNQENVEGTWDSNYMIVQHMHGDSWLNTDDSTSNSNDATGEAGNPSYQQSCKIGYGVEFGGNDYITFGSDSSLKPSTVCVEAWINSDSAPLGRSAFSMPYDDGGIWDYPFVAYTLHRDGEYSLDGQINVDGIYIQAQWVHGVNVGVWYHSVFTYDGNILKLYTNGVERDSISYSGDITYSGSPVLVAGAYSSHSPGGYWDGELDELRVSNVARSSAWITTEYNNQNNPISFLSFGEQEGTVLEIGEITGGLLKANAVIMNIGQRDGFDVDYTITLNGGLILAGQTTTGEIDVPAGDQVSVNTNIVLGFGNTVMTVTADIESVTSDTKDADAFVLLFFIRMK